MNKLKLTKERQERFLDALANTGSVTAAAAVANTSRTRVYELWKTEPAFASAWQEAEEIATDGLKTRRVGEPSKGSQNRLLALASSFATMTVNPSWSGAPRITCSWRCSKRVGRRAVKGRCASNCRHFDPLLMPPVR
jgi:hypothetical protein